MVRAQLVRGMLLGKPPQTRPEEKLNQLTTAQGEAQTMPLEPSLLFRARSSGNRGVGGAIFRDAGREGGGLPSVHKRGP